jgi:hypothetical protein
MSKYIIEVDDWPYEPTNSDGTRLYKVKNFTIAFTKQELDKLQKVHNEDYDWKCFQEFYNDFSEKTRGWLINKPYNEVSKIHKDYLIKAKKLRSGLFYEHITQYNRFKERCLLSSINGNTVDVILKDGTVSNIDKYDFVEGWRQIDVKFDGEDRIDFYFDILSTLRKEEANENYIPF